MENIFSFILGLVLGGVVIWFFAKRKASQGEATPASVKTSASDKSSAGQADEVNQFEKSLGPKMGPGWRPKA